MLKVDFNFNASDLEKAIMKAAAEEIMKKVRAVRCPEHGQYAAITAQGRSLSNMSFEVSGCCEKLTGEVKRKLS